MDDGDSKKRKIQTNTLALVAVATHPPTHVSIQHFFLTVLASTLSSLFVLCCTPTVPTVLSHPSTKKLMTQVEICARVNGARGCFILQLLVFVTIYMGVASTSKSGDWMPLDVDAEAKEETAI